MDTSKIRPGLMVHAKGDGSMKGAPGEHIGTVDHIDGPNYIKLRKDDSPDGEHHWISTDIVSHVNDKAVYLSCTKRELSGHVFDALPSVEKSEAEKKIRTISRQELMSRLNRGDNPQLVNVLEPKNYDLGSIKGSIKIPGSKLDTRANELDRSHEVITYCSSKDCSAAKKAAEKLSSMGFNAAFYEGGIEEWKQSGFPLESEKEAAA